MGDGWQRQSEARVRQLQWALRVVGVAWTLYWCALLLNELSSAALWDGTSWIAPFVMWGHGGREYLIMLATDNVAIGVYLALSASNPLRHRHFIDFALVANGLHMASMLAMALADAHEHAKLLGDVPAGTLPTVALAILWLRVRRAEHRGGSTPARARAASGR